MMTKQKKLFAGLDCLPGQEDLFPTDGQTRLRDLDVGEEFLFLDDNPNNTHAFEYRGNGWYGRPYGGGPWHSDDNPLVESLTPICNCPMPGCVINVDCPVHSKETSDD